MSQVLIREAHVNELYPEVDPGNDHALELYRRAGFQDHDGILLTKRVPAQKAKS